MEVRFHLGIAPCRSRADAEPTALPMRPGELFELFCPQGFLSHTHLYLLTEVEHQIMAWFGLEGSFKGRLVQHPYNEQGHLQRDQVGQPESPTWVHLAAMGEEEALLEGKSYLCLGSIRLKRMNPTMSSSEQSKKLRLLKAVTETEVEEWA